MNLVLSVACIVIVIIFGIKIVKELKKINDDVVKGIFYYLILAIIFPFVVYYMDRYNIPTVLKYATDIDTNNWLNFIGNYVAVIFSSVISAVFLIFVTKRQIETAYDSNREQFRLQNLPLLDYFFENRGARFDLEESISYNAKSTGHLGHVAFSMYISNIGLNAVRKSFFVIDWGMIDTEKIIEFSQQDSINKNQINRINFRIDNIDFGLHKINVYVYYQDLLKNWYQQEVNLQLRIRNDELKSVSIKSDVQEEIMLDELPKVICEYINETKELR